MAKYQPLDDNPFADITSPSDNPFADIGTVSPTAKSLGATALDVVKQIPSGLIAGTEAIATFPAQAAGLVGGLVNKVLPGDPQREAEQAAIRDLAKKQGGTAGIAPYLPQPTTKLGQFARTGAEFIPATVAGARTLSIPRAVGVGATGGLTSEAAGQATEGTAAELPARLVGGLVGTAGAARASEAAAARRALPNVEKNEEAAGKLYDQFRNSGVNYDPRVSPGFSQAIKTELQTRGLTDSSAVAGGTWGAITKALEKTDAQGNLIGARTPQDFHTLYQELGHIASGAGANKGERLAANIAQERLLQFMENTPQGALTGNVNAPAQAVEALREANQIWAAAQRAKNVSGRIVKAEDKTGASFSGLNLENELRRRLGVLADPEKARQSGFSQGEQAALRRFGQGTAGPNTLRYVGNALAGGGGIGVPIVGGITGTAGGGISYLTGGDPVTGALAGAALPLAGLGARYGSNKWALSRARELERLMLARSPLAAGRIPPTQPSLPLAAIPPTLGTLGDYELHPNEGYPYYAPRGGP